MRLDPADLLNPRAQGPSQTSSLLGAKRNTVFDIFAHEHSALCRPTDCGLTDHADAVVAARRWATRITEGRRGLIRLPVVGPHPQFTFAALAVFGPFFRLSHDTAYAWQCMHLSRLPNPRLARLVKKESTRLPSEDPIDSFAYYLDRLRYSPSLALISGVDWDNILLDSVRADRLLGRPRKPTLRLPEDIAPADAFMEAIAPVMREPEAPVDPVTEAPTRRQGTHLSPRHRFTSPSPSRRPPRPPTSLHPTRHRPSPPAPPHPTTASTQPSPPWRP